MVIQRPVIVSFISRHAHLADCGAGVARCTVLVVVGCGRAYGRRGGGREEGKDLASRVPLVVKLALQFKIPDQFMWLLWDCSKFNAVAVWGLVLKSLLLGGWGIEGG